MKKFALIGSAGYIAPRHMRAIKDTGNILVATLDKSDSVGIIDSYFPESDFFTEFERFDRHIEKQKRERGDKVDYVSICSPNYLHDAHIRFALRVGAHAVCEKPIVLNPWNILPIKELAEETGKKIYTILQLRLHPSIRELKQQVEDNPDTIYDIDLTYISARGRWYFISWKGDLSKSGGIATNIGIHFFDMLTWIFGPVKESTVHVSKTDKAAGFLELQQARVRWFLSVDGGDLPEEVIDTGSTTYRSVVINGHAIEFSNGFTDLHTASYEHLLNGEGFTIDDAKSSIDIVSNIRNANPIGLRGDYHPALKKTAVV